MLICAVASLALIIAGAVIMDWYQLTLDGIAAGNRVTIDLRSVHACSIEHLCLRRSLAPLPGMFPTLAAVTLWSSLAFGALVAFQAGARLLTGSAHDAFTKLGYMVALMAISLAVATAYLFGPEPDGVSLRFDAALHRTWAPATLIAGLSAGFAAIYLAVARESSDPDAAYRPVTIPPALALEARARHASIPFPVPPGEQTDFLLAAQARTNPAREQTGTLRAAQVPSDPLYARTQTGTLRAAPRSPGSPYTRTQTGTLRAAPPSPASPYTREQTGTLRAAPSSPASPYTRTQTGTLRAAPASPASPYTREQTGTLRAAPPASNPPYARARAGTQPPVDPRYARERTGVTRAPPSPTGSSDSREQTGTLRARPSPASVYVREQTGTLRAQPSSNPPFGPARAATQPPVDPRHARARAGTQPPVDPRYARERTGITRASPSPTGSSDSREQTGTLRARPSPASVYAREQTGTLRAPPLSMDEPPRRERTAIMHGAYPRANPLHAREQTGVLRAARSSSGPPQAREQTGMMRAARPPSEPPGSISGPPSRTRGGSLPPVPAHLRNRLQYVALTAELTGGGIDARREDGLSRLVLWRDVVGVVARRMPPVYDGAVFVDIVSTAGSTLRIVPWTRITGELIEADGDDRPRALVEHVVSRCPGARLDPATRTFLDTGEPAQLPDLDTLRAHDERLA